MGRYSQTNIRPTKPRDQTHPIWRGIGCVLFIVVPLISFGLAEVIVQDPTAQTYIPYQLMGTPALPKYLWNVEYLPPILTFIQNQANITAVIVFFLFILLILGTFVAVVNAFIYRYIGPPRYGPQDAPPPNIKVKRYKR